MKYIARVLVIACGVLVALTAFGSGAASADPYVGKTYAEAAAKISQKSGKPVIATVSGSQLATDECIVISWSRSIFRDSSGEARRREFLLNLDCNRALASPGHPGGSLMTPGGPQRKKDEAFAARVTKNPEICNQSESYAKRCARVCIKNKLCEVKA